MAHNSISPAKLLHDFASKKRLGFPVYDVSKRCGAMENVFKCQLRIGEISAIGFGRSKQIAKQDAACKALDKMAEIGIYNDRDSSHKYFNPQMHRNEPNDSEQSITDYVSKLQGICHKKYLSHHPIYTQEKQQETSRFTCSCQLSSMITNAIASTKKQAKQLSAKLMLEQVNRNFFESGAQ